MTAKIVLYILIIYIKTIAQLSGLWPYFYDKKNQVFKTTCILKLIPILTCIFLMLSMLYSGKIIFSETPGLFETDAANFIQTMIILSKIIMFITIYSQSYIDGDFLENLTKRAQDLYIKINTTTVATNTNYRSLLYMGIFKTVILPTIIVVTECFKIDKIAPPARDNPTLTFFVILPNWIFCIVPNLFLMGMIIALHYFRQLNTTLSEVVSHTIIMDTTEGNRGQYHHMKWFCDLSDKVDAVSVVHIELCNLVKIWNRLFSVSVFVWVSYKVILILFQLFFTFVLVRDWFTAELNRDKAVFHFADVILIESFEVLIIAVNVIMAVHICYSCEAEVSYRYLQSNSSLK